MSAARKCTGKEKNKEKEQRKTNINEKAEINRIVDTKTNWIAQLYNSLKTMKLIGLPKASLQQQVSQWRTWIKQLPALGDLYVLLVPIKSVNVMRARSIFISTMLCNIFIRATNLIYFGVHYISLGGSPLLEYNETWYIIFGRYHVPVVSSKPDLYTSYKNAYLSICRQTLSGTRLADCTYLYIQISVGLQTRQPEFRAGIWLVVGNFLDEQSYRWIS